MASSVADVPPPAATRRSPQAQAGDQPGAGAVMGAVLRRMGEVLGPGATYSLVHYGALEEGMLLADRGGATTTEDAVALVADLLGIEARLEDDEGGQVHVKVQQGPAFALNDRASMGLLVGLLEGVLTTARRRKMQITSEPMLDAMGVVDLELAG